MLGDYDNGAILISLSSTIKTDVKDLLHKKNSPNTDRERVSIVTYSITTLNVYKRFITYTHRPVILICEIVPYLSHNYKATFDLAMF